MVGGVWQAVDYTFTEAGSPSLPYLTSPQPNTTLGGGSQLFTWNPGGGATEFQLLVGTEGPGSSDIYKGSATMSHSANVSGIPTNGVYFYIRLRYRLNNVVSELDYRCTEFGTPTPPQLIAPVLGTTLSGSTVTFSWNPGSERQFQFRLGNVRGANDIYGSLETTQTSVTVTTVPTDGRTIHARLYYMVTGVWQFIDYTYTTGP
jgi:hypothetical protein